MALSQNQIIDIENVLRNSLRHKFQNYNPEPASMPFHTRLLGKDRLALYSFIHSLNTNFGTSIFEPVALALASSSFTSAASKQTAGTQISSEAHHVIQNIMDGLATATSSPNKPEEIIAIKEVCRQGEMKKVKLTKVDIKLVAHDGTIYLFDLKTAKPNAGGFKEFKRTLLEWIAATLAGNPTADVQSFIAIPYNPYEPEPYNRWTMRGMLDLDKELKVASEFWDFIGGEGAYQNLLDIFERIGIELRTEIDDYFARYNKQN
ncbi:MAG: restriction endonuclease [Candidatus Schekmanbacteria bacterium RIFCSPHIGHO2_02_FULL_38_11]|uniref:type II site-specific deoxyribonuclease n=1 Tax=Candidatus Schekmanbacteria bacterium RIFCSPLOWO2_12_FULL_38_15 TaxID=1817883 RepID=A0A1F7SE96_9BACT|nr:MAG: restriction endonuclease [Candidatus Schekmanbacteria bacterium RIFCSPHIGHO2_02_FULL_38_11]OGL49126.1 MAG: restriction endonuclease [Candidatus Schekmanbacteria bacterium RIFCSPLOWO2_02_FULL_38_14]OGL52102.1 MAG: restriction endonuclease [Candidatus Schekmanbacteria bacterium RIFCSPLOWO2_12_FULL_38_15]